MGKICSHWFWTPLPLYKRWEMVSCVDIEARAYRSIGYRVSTHQLTKYLRIREYSLAGGTLTVWYAPFSIFRMLKRMGDGPTDRPTDRRTDIVTYRSRSTQQKQVIIDA